MQFIIITTIIIIYIVSIVVLLFIPINYHYATRQAPRPSGTAPPSATAAIYPINSG